MLSKKIETHEARKQSTHEPGPTSVAMPSGGATAVAAVVANRMISLSEGKIRRIIGVSGFCLTVVTLVLGLLTHYGLAAVLLAATLTVYRMGVLSE